MKKALLIAAAILMFAGSVNAQGTAYIGVYGDIDHSVCTLSPPVYTPFHAWIMVLPSVRGMQAAEFTMLLPPTVISTGSAKNPDVTVELGSLTGGISTAFGTCHLGWTYLYDVTLMSLSFGVPGYVGLSGDISVNPPIFAVASCEPGYPSEPVIYHAPLALYQGCNVGVQSSTWGAIKNLF
jgi:hypothetical protein